MGIGLAAKVNYPSVAVTPENVVYIVKPGDNIAISFLVRIQGLRQEFACLSTRDIGRPSQLDSLERNPRIFRKPFFFRDIQS